MSLRIYTTYTGFEQQSSSIVAVLAKYVAVTFNRSLWCHSKLYILTRDLSHAVTFFTTARMCIVGKLLLCNNKLVCCASLE
jgi:hypothetical protein